MDPTASTQPTAAPTQASPSVSAEEVCALPLVVVEGSRQVLHHHDQILWAHLASRPVPGPHPSPNGLHISTLPSTFLPASLSQVHQQVQQAQKVTERKDCTVSEGWKSWAVASRGLPFVSEGSEVSEGLPPVSALLPPGIEEIALLALPQLSQVRRSDDSSQPEATLGHTALPVGPFAHPSPPPTTTAPAVTKPSEVKRKDGGLMALREYLAELDALAPTQGTAAHSPTSPRSGASTTSHSSGRASKVISEVQGSVCPFRFASPLPAHDSAAHADLLALLASLQTHTSSNSTPVGKEENFQEATLEWIDRHHDWMSMLLAGLCVSVVNLEEDPFVGSRVGHRSAEASRGFCLAPARPRRHSRAQRINIGANRSLSTSDKQSEDPSEAPAATTAPAHPTEASPAESQASESKSDSPLDKDKGKLAIESKPTEESAAEGTDKAQGDADAEPALATNPETPEETAEDDEEAEEDEEEAEESDTDGEGQETDEAPAKATPNPSSTPQAWEPGLPRQRFVRLLHAQAMSSRPLGRLALTGSVSSAKIDPAHPHDRVRFAEAKKWPAHSVLRISLDRLLPSDPSAPPPGAKRSATTGLGFHPNLVRPSHVVYSIPQLPSTPTTSSPEASVRAHLVYGLRQSEVFTLDSLFRFSSEMLGSDTMRLFLVYALMRTLDFVHQQGLAHGAFSPKAVSLDQFLWPRVHGLTMALPLPTMALPLPTLALPLPHALPSTEPSPSATRHQGPKSPNPKRPSLRREGPTVGVESALASTEARLASSVTRQSWATALAEWQAGRLSNLEYLLFLNALAGRTSGEANFHPVVPWVIDFKAPNSWRDLTKGKYRLAKGDEQLDFTYAATSAAAAKMSAGGGGGAFATSVADPSTKGPAPAPSAGAPPLGHHLSDMMSELTYYNYFARRTPVETLRRAVRTNYQPNEYPHSMERLFQWSPDECIPEFYTDERIFKSIHPDMGDLQVPAWARDPREFLALHRQALESPHVSAHIHLWIDLTFGYRLSGEAGREAKNIALIDRTTRRTSGFVQLFSLAHPPRGTGRGTGRGTKRWADLPALRIRPQDSAGSLFGISSGSIATFSTLPAALSADSAGEGSTGGPQAPAESSEGQASPSGTSPPGSAVPTSGSESSESQETSGGSGASKGTEKSDRSDRTEAKDRGGLDKSNEWPAPDSKDSKGLGESKIDDSGDSSTEGPSGQGPVSPAKEKSAATSATVEPISLSKVFVEDLVSQESASRFVAHASKLEPIFFSPVSFILGPVSAELTGEEKNALAQVSDSFALAAMAYQIFTGSPLFTATTWPAFVEALAGTVLAGLRGRSPGPSRPSRSAKPDLSVAQSMGGESGEEWSSSDSEDSDGSDSQPSDGPVDFGTDPLDPFGEFSPHPKEETNDDPMVTGWDARDGVHEWWAGHLVALAAARAELPSAPSLATAGSSAVPTGGQQSIGQSGGPLGSGAASGSVLAGGGTGGLWPSLLALIADLALHTPLLLLTRICQRLWGGAGPSESAGDVEGGQGLVPSLGAVLGASLHLPAHYLPLSAKLRSLRAELHSSIAPVRIPTAPNPALDAPATEGMEQFFDTATAQTLTPGSDEPSARPTIRRPPPHRREGSATSAATPSTPVSVIGSISSSALPTAGPGPAPGPSGASAIPRPPVFPAYFETVYGFLAQFEAFESDEQRAVQASANVALVINLLPPSGFALVLPYLLTLFASPNPNVLKHALNLVEPLCLKLGRSRAVGCLLEPLTKLFEHRDKMVSITQELVSYRFVAGLYRHFGLGAFLKHFLPHLIDALRPKTPAPSSDDHAAHPQTTLIARIASQTICHLLSLLGVVVYVKVVLWPVLCLLGKSPQSSSPGVVCETLVDLAQLLGEELTARHIVDYLILLLQKCVHKGAREAQEARKSIASPEASDSSAVAIANVALALLERLVLLPVMSGPRIARAMVVENGFLFSLLLTPHLCDRALFPPLIDLLAAITHKIGYNVSIKYVRPYLQHFFASYEALAKAQSPADIAAAPDVDWAALQSVYTAQLVFSVSSKFKDILDAKFRGSIATGLATDAPGGPGEFPAASALSTSLPRDEPSGFTASLPTLSEPVSIQHSAPLEALMLAGWLQTLPHGAPVSLPAVPSPTWPWDGADSQLDSPQGLPGVGGEGLGPGQVGGHGASILRSPDGPQTSAASSRRSVSTTPLNLDNSGLGGELGGVGGKQGTSQFFWNFPPLAKAQMDALQSALSPKRVLSWAFTGAVVSSFKEHSGAIKGLVVHDTERYFLSTARDNLVKCWDLHSDLASRQTYAGHRQSVNATAFVDRGSLVASSDGTIHIWELERAMKIMHLEHASAFTCFSPYVDGKIIVGGTSANTITLTDLRSPTDQCEWVLPASAPRVVAFYGANDMYVAVGQQNGSITLIDARSGLLLYNWRAHDGPVLELKPIADAQGQFLFSTGQDRNIALWDLQGCGLSSATGPRLATFFKGHRDAQVDFDIYNNDLYSINGQKFAITPVHHPSTVVQLNRHKLPPKAGLKSNALTAIRILAHHQLLLMGLDDGQIKVII